MSSRDRATAWIRDNGFDLRLQTIMFVRIKRHALKRDNDLMLVAVLVRSDRVEGVPSQRFVASLAKARERWKEIPIQQTRFGRGSRRNSLTCASAKATAHPGETRNCRGSAASSRCNISLWCLK